MEFIRELIGERWIKVRVGGSFSQSKQTDLGISQGEVLSVTLFLVAINGVLGELGNGVDGSLFTDNLAIYITTRSQIVAWQLGHCKMCQTSWMHGQQKGSNHLPQQNSKHDI